MGKEKERVSTISTLLVGTALAAQVLENSYY